MYNYNSSNKIIAESGEIRHDGMGEKHAQFNLQTSGIKPFDAVRMAGIPEDCNKNSI